MTHFELSEHLTRHGPAGVPFLSELRPLYPFHALPPIRRKQYTKIFIDFFPVSVPYQTSSSSPGLEDAGSRHLPEGQGAWRLGVLEGIACWLFIYLHALRGDRVVVCLFPAVPSSSPCGAQVALVHSLQMNVLAFRVEVKRIWEASLLLIYLVENFIFQPGPANQ